MEAPDEKLVVSVLRDLNELINNSDALRARLEHSQQELLSVKLGDSLFIAIKAKSQLEDIFCHCVHNNSLVVSDFVLKINNTLIFKVCLKESSKLVYINLQLLLLFKVSIMIVSLILACWRLLEETLRGHHGLKSWRIFFSAYLSMEEGSDLHVETLDLLGKGKSI